jgi:hypothetical protein
MGTHVLWFIAALVLTAGAPATGQQSTPSGSDTFTWIGELVSLDATTSTMTVKSRIAYQEAVSELKQFKPGEPLLVVWSGVSDHREAVRQFRRPEANRVVTDMHVTPAELASPEATHQYVTLRVKVPAAALTAIASVKPGEWVTVTSRQRPATEAEAVLSVKPYTGSSTAATTTK